MGGATGKVAPTVLRRVFVRVAMLTWEYPPRIVGGIARHVEELSWALARQGHAVHVVTCAFADAPAEEQYNGVWVHRVEPFTPVNDFVHWVHQLNAAMHDRASDILAQWSRDAPDAKRLDRDRAILVHAHDWVAHFSAVRLKHAYHLPVVATVHATEHGRNQGIRTDQQRYIHATERDLTTEAWRVIVCSEFMKGEVERTLNTPSDKMDVIPNGVRMSKFEFPFTKAEAAAFRLSYASPEERMVVFSGRMVREKGAHVLLEALRMVRDMGVPAKLVVVGGGERGHLERQAQESGIGANVYFTGFIPDDTLLRLYRVADAACFPSLYEPFGIVALEAMAAGVPVVVSDAGGLAEIVEHDRTGSVVWRDSADGLAWGLKRALTDTAQARAMASAARTKCQEVYNWDRVAGLTSDVYRRVWGEYVTSTW